jgi:hypothetical protein
MLTKIIAVVLAGITLIFAARAEERFGHNLVEARIKLPKETFLRGATDPVADLMVELTLTNRSKPENLKPVTREITVVDPLTPEQLEAIHKKAGEMALTEESLKELTAITAANVKKSTKDVFSPNKESLGYAYVEPQLGPQDNIEFVITKLPEEGEAVPANAKPVIAPRDNAADHIGKTELTPTLYLAAGATSPAFSLPVGKFYVIRDPGVYSIKAVLRLIGDSQVESKVKALESNEEKFRVLPFKAVDQKISEIRSHWDDYERGVPTFAYMLYQVKTSGVFDEIWHVQRIPVRGQNRWEWARLCTVKAGTLAEVVQLAPKKVAVLAQLQSGNAGFYKIDFTAVGAKVTADEKEVKDNTMPKIKVEGGNATLE